MSEKERIPPRSGHSRPPDRREFLRYSLAGALGATVAEPRWALGEFDSPHEEHNGPAKRPAFSRIVKVVSEKLLPVRTVHRPYLRDCIALGLCRLTEQNDPRDAWHRLLKADDVILLKFNQSGADQIGTTPPMVSELLTSLTAAGWDPQKIILLEAPPDREWTPKTRAADLRWQGREIRFGSSGKDNFLAALDEATAIINVPFLKTHHLAVMTCCLKNLSHGLIRHPGRFHSDGCDPAIAEIVNSPDIRSKLRLNIVNALRVVPDCGRKARDPVPHAAGTLLLGEDPVACDASGFALLKEIRSLQGLPSLLPAARLPRYLATAARLGLGEVDAERIDVNKLEV